jgi:hypothetical protein
MAHLWVSRKIGACGDPVVMLAQGRDDHVLREGGLFYLDRVHHLQGLGKRLQLFGSGEDSSPDFVPCLFGRSS